MLEGGNRQGWHREGCQGVLRAFRVVQRMVEAGNGSSSVEGGIKSIEGSNGQGWQRDAIEGVAGDQWVVRA